MHDHWFHPTAYIRYQREFSHDDICTLMQWMWYKIRGLEAVIADKNQQIAELKDELCKSRRRR